jgi:hypothetical protein
MKQRLHRLGRLVSLPKRSLTTLTLYLPSFLVFNAGQRPTELLAPTFLDFPVYAPFRLDSFVSDSCSPSFLTTHTHIKSTFCVYSIVPLAGILSLRDLTSCRVKVTMEETFLTVDQSCVFQAAIFPCYQNRN